MREEKQENLDQLREIYAGIVERGDCLSLRDMAVKGADILAAGVKPGRKVGDILAQMLDDVLDVPEHNNKEYLMGRYCK